MLDGEVRALKRIAETADTFSTVPAAVKVNGRNVAGYVSIESRSGAQVATEDARAVVRLHAYRHGRNADALP